MALDGTYARLFTLQAAGYETSSHDRASGGGRRPRSGPVPRNAVPALAAVPERAVPDGRLVAVGDDPSASSDSRELGYFHGDLLLGVVLRRLPAEPG
ncbi:MULTISPECIES: hypothetical protein [Thermomonosporaceae]|uniref:hypothetical protein n=1 Tax=Thermomonosporaceae TaxID=2012 RepID=UPI00255ADE36|nr:MULTISPECIES: hypothetical protein [Thermomonosporaceae]MDL4772526.1 hypothetical protein [Actinomadura xylanilytica]